MEEDKKEIISDSPLEENNIVSEEETGENEENIIVGIFRKIASGLRRVVESRCYVAVRHFLKIMFLYFKKYFSIYFDKLSALVKSNFFIGLFTVFLMNLLFLSGIETTVDLTIGADALNLVKAFSMTPGEIWNSGANSGYLYTLYLKLISFFAADVVEVYYLNISVLSALSTMFIYIYCRLITKKTANSVLFAFLWLICCFNVSLYEKDTLFALAVILVGFISTEFISSSSLKFLVISFFLFISSYVCEAYFIPFAIILSIYVLMLLFDIKRRWREFAPLLLFCCVLYFAWQKGLPFLSDKESSFIRSFKECFFLNWQNWQEITASQLYDSEYKDYVWLSTFGDTDNIFLAFLASPLTILHHIFTNFFNTLRVVGENLFFHYPFILPTNSYRSIVIEGMLFILFFASFLGGALEHDKSRKAVMYRHGLRITIWMLTLVSPLICGIVFYPYPFYIVELGCFFLLFGGIFGLELLSNLNIAFSENKKSLLLVCFCLLCIVPRVYTMPPKTDIMVNPSRVFGKSYATLPIKETVNFVNSLNITAKVNVYSIEDGYINYFPENYKAVSLPKDGFKTVINKKKIDMVIETSGFSTSPKDKELIKFLKNPEKYGYYTIGVPGFSENRLIIRNGLACDNVLCRKKINIIDTPKEDKKEENTKKDRNKNREISKQADKKNNAGKDKNKDEFSLSRLF